MKHIFTIFSILAFLFFYNSTLYSQACTPDPGFTAEGLSPDTIVNMSPACVPIPYAQTFTIHPPPDTVVSGFTFIINYLMIDSVVGMPAGFSYACSPANCTYPGGTIGCAIISGIPTLSQIGVYSLTIYGTIQAYHPMFGTILQPVIYTGYKLKIGGGITLAPGSTNAGCGISDGSVWSGVTGGAAPLSYLWNTAPISTTDTVLNLPAGPYQINITDNYGCMDSSNISIVNPGGPVIDTIMGTNNACFGDSTGTAIPTISLGTAPYTYSWSTGDTTSTLSNLPAGVYGLQVTDSNNCVGIFQTVTITTPSVVNGALSSTSETCIGCNDGSASVVPSGGTSPFTYLWSNSVTNDTINGLTTGFYVVTITDSQGCSFTDSVMVNNTAGISENIMKSSFIIYPNPSKDFITIESGTTNNDLKKIAVIDMYGKLISNFETTNNIYSIDIHMLPTGIYLIYINSTDANQVFKIIKN